MNVPLFRTADMRGTHQSNMKREARGSALRRPTEASGILHRLPAAHPPSLSTAWREADLAASTIYALRGGNALAIFRKRIIIYRQRRAHLHLAAL